MYHKTKFKQTIVGDQLKKTRIFLMKLTTIRKNGLIYTKFYRLDTNIS